MEKLFQALSKPAKWVFVIGGFFYAVWFSISTATGMGNNPMSVITSLIIMTVGTALLVATPLLILLKKESAAKILFVFLLGYWLLSTIQAWFMYADALVNSNDALSIVSGIFSFILGLGTVTILVLTVLEFILKKPAFRFISFIIFLAIVGLAFITSIFLIINTIRLDAFWPNGVDFFVQYMILPAVLCFGYLFFFGAPAQK